MGDNWERYCPLTCILESSRVIWLISRYLVLETLTFTSIGIVSIVIAYCGGKAYSQIAGSAVTDTWEEWALALTLGLITSEIPKSVRSALVSNSLQSTINVLRLILILILLPTGVYFQYVAFQNRVHYVPQKQHNKSRGTDEQDADDDDNQPLDTNDLIFIASFVGVIYLIARILACYREFQEKKIKLQLGIQEGASESRFYFFHYLGLSLIELMALTLQFLCLLGAGAFFQFTFFRDWFTFLICCFTGAILGQGFDLLENEYFPLDSYLGGLEPFYAVIHWDARRYLIIVLGYPLISVAYFDKDFYRDFGGTGRNYIFIWFASVIALNVAMFVRCQTLFSYALHSRVRIHPLQGYGRRAYLQRRSGSGDGPRPRPPHDGGGMPDGLGSRIKSLVGGYFPLHLDSHLRELRWRNGTNDQGSISTGTCSSLITRMNNNNVTITAVRRSASLMTAMGSSRERVEESPTTSIQHENENEKEEKPVMSAENLTDPNLNVEEAWPDEDAKVEAVTVVDSVTTSTLQSVKHFHSRPSSPPVVKLKRCPSNLPCMVGREVNEKVEGINNE